MEFIIDQLNKSFDHKEVLRDVSFRFEEGKIYGLLGRNGAGKTTLMNCLNRDLSVDGGSFYLEDRGTKLDVSPEDLGYVLSTPTVPEFLTGREFLKFFLDCDHSLLTYSSYKQPKTVLKLFHIRLWEITKINVASALILGLGLDGLLLMSGGKSGGTDPDKGRLVFPQSVSSQKSPLFPI